MRIVTILVSLLALFLTVELSAEGSKYDKKVAQDIESFRAFYAEKFPNIEGFSSYKDGVYTIDESSREQWLEIEEFPPYELSIDEGHELFEQAFANGKNYARCFDNDGMGVRQNYPYFDKDTKQVITLELAINNCRKANAEAPLKYGQGEIALISAYMASTSRGKVFEVKVPNKAAYKAYLEGKKFFYAERGQLNFSCSGCHLGVVGNLLRADIVGPAIGHPTSFPVHRAAWGELGTLHKRYAACNRMVRAKPFALQGPEYRNLEYFQSLMSQAMEINGPSVRK